MLETGQVVSAENGQVQVHFKRTSACERCGACGMLANGQDMIVTLENTIEARPGDQVVVQMPTQGMLQASAIVYVIPLLLLVAGAVVGKLALAPLFAGAESDVVAAISGIALCALGFLGIHLLEPKLRRQKRFQLQMVSVHRAAQGQEEEQIDKE